MLSRLYLLALLLQGHKFESRIWHFVHIIVTPDSCPLRLEATSKRVHAVHTHFGLKSLRTRQVVRLHSYLHQLQIEPFTFAKWWHPHPESSINRTLATRRSRCRTIVKGQMDLIEHATILTRTKPEEWNLPDQIAHATIWMHLSKSVYYTV